MKTQAAIRAAFWANHPQFKDDYRVKKRQNDYCTDIRCAFVEYVDALARGGVITQKLADRVTL